MHPHDTGVTELGQRPGLTHEPFGESRIGVRFAGQDLQGNQPIQVRLACLVHGPHAATPDQGQDLELRKQPGHIFNGRRLKCFRLDLFRGRPPCLHQTGRAQPLNGLDIQCSSTVLARLVRRFVCHDTISYQYVRHSVCNATAH